MGIALLPGTSPVEHLRENVTSAALTLPEDALAERDAIASEAGAPARSE